MHGAEACSSNSRAAALPRQNVRVGKKAAGRLFGGTGHMGMPEVRA